MAPAVAMAEGSGRSKGNVGSMILVAVVAAALVGGAAGFGAGYLVSPKTAPRAPYTPQAREFYVFTDTINFNETALGIPHDVFVPYRIVVYQGDEVTIHYYNLEPPEEPEDHTFTMAAPYAMDYNVEAGQNITVHFVADTPGIFSYYCRYHQPTMTGYLVVIAP